MSLILEFISFYFNFYIYNIKQAKANLTESKDMRRRLHISIVESRKRSGKHEYCRI